jgi:protein-disulfide isomerase
MGVESRIKERLADAVASSYYKKWFKRWWGILFMLIAVGFIIFLLYFIFLTISNIRHINNGDIYIAESDVWITAEQFQENQEATVDLFTGDDPWLGSEEPLIYIVAFESFACPFCREDQDDIRKMVAKFGSIVRFIAKDFPTEGLHPDVFNAHIAADCANEQGRYWEFRDVLFDNGDNFGKANIKKLANQFGLNEQQFDSCFDSEKFAKEIRQDYADGVQAGVVGTPSYLINGHLIPGSISYEMWEEIIGFILKETY